LERIPNAESCTNSVPSNISGIFEFDIGETVMLNFKIPVLKTTEPIDQEIPGRQKRSPASSPAAPTITCLSATLGAFVMTAAGQTGTRNRRSPFGSPERREENEHVSGNG
jgi:hypothetical protein